MNVLWIAFLVVLSVSVHAQCDLVIEYDVAGNRIFRGTPCATDCSTHVINVDDSGSGSLRNAIFCAQDGETVSFAPDLANATIDITSRKLLIDKNISINTYAMPPNMGNTVTPPEIVHVKSEINDHIFEVSQNATVLVKGLYFHPKIGYNSNPLSILNHGTLSLEELEIIHETFVGSQAVINHGTLNIIGLVKLVDYD